jgi:hypothetical protein
MSPFPATVPGPSTCAQKPGDRVGEIGLGGVGGVVEVIADAHRHKRLPAVSRPPLGTPVVL